MGKSQAELQEQLDEISQYPNPIDRAWQIRHLKINGYFLPTRGQEIALSAILVISLFQSFFNEVWMTKTGLIWQPEWITQITTWMKNQTINSKGDIKIFSINQQDILKYFGIKDELLFIFSDIGTMMYFHHIVFVSGLLSVLFFLIKLFGHTEDVLGFSIVNPRYINSLGRFLKIIIFTLPAMIIVLGYVLMLINLIHWDISIDMYYNLYIERSPIATVIANRSFIVTAIFINILFLGFFTIIKGWFELFFLLLKKIFNFIVNLY